MPIKFFPKQGGRVEFSSPEEAAAFFKRIENPKEDRKPKILPTPTNRQFRSGSQSTPAKRLQDYWDSKKGIPVLPRDPSKKPSLKEAIQRIIGGKELKVPQIFEELKKRHWVPESRDPLAYVRYSLSVNRDVFRSKYRGGPYYLTPGNPYRVRTNKNTKPKRAKKKMIRIGDPTPARSTVS